MTVVRFPGHRWHRDCHQDYCLTCRGGLALCLVCNGAEGTLPTDCPGGAMDTDTEDAVYNGELDYVRDVGWIRPTHRSWRRKL